MRYFVGGEGPPLLVVHGCGEGAMSWFAAARELVNCYRVCIPDLPGFGGSQRLERIHFLKYVGFIDEFAASIGLQEFHLAGHSMGGGIALAYALRFPEKVARLTLVSSIGLGREIAFWARLLSAPAIRWTLTEVAIGTMEGVEQMVRFVRAPIRFENPIPRVKAELGAGMVGFRGQTTVLLGRLSELGVPTLVVWGEEDNTVPASHASRAAGLIRDCQVHVFSGAGHALYRERAGELCRLLARFRDQAIALRDGPADEL